MSYYQKPKPWQCVQLDTITQKMSRFFKMKTSRGNVIKKKKRVFENERASLSVQQMRVRMRPRPWSKRWERPKFNIKGIRFDLCLTPEKMEYTAQKWGEPWREYDMLKEYDTSKLEEEIFREVQQGMSKSGTAS